MSRAGSLLKLLGFVAVLGVVTTSAQVPPVEDVQELSVTTPESCNPPDPPPLLTIAKGFESGWGHDRPGFMGADFIIRDPDAWAAFWRVHNPESDPPPVDFERRVVIATIQGPQSTGGGPNISIVDLRPEGPLTEVVIVDDERPGPLDVITNPFHIVSVRRDLLPGQRSATFLHARPIPETGVVTGRVFAIRPEGDPLPLPGAHVVLARPGTEPRHTLGGLDGSYFFVNVEPGEYILRAEHPDFEPREVPIVVEPDRLVGHNFFLPRIPFGLIAGAVLGQPPEGEPFPLRGALVELFRGAERVDHRRTNEEGFFIFPRVAPGEYLVVASHEGFLPEEFLAVVEPDGHVEHVFVLQPAPQPGAFLGRVVGEQGPEWVPIPGALVRLINAEGQEVRRAITNRRGAFAMREVPPGSYLGRAEAEGWVPAETEVLIRPGEPTYHLFELQRPQQ